MNYISTRGQAAKESFSSIVLKGLATDGGLYMPERYPKFSLGQLDSFRTMTYAEAAFEVLSRFADDIPQDDLKRLCEATYRAEIYANTRSGSDANDITPVREIGEELYLLELSNGPTLAFKDMAMQFLGHLFEYLLEKQNASLNILGATSGDTGSAAEYAMRGKKGIRVFMLSPHARMSAFQRAQMYSLKDENIFNIALKGVFDDAQDIVKSIGRDAAFKKEYRIGTVNSINWARVAAQVVYYVRGYLAVTKDSSEVVDVSVPTGNFGDILAGWIAKKMGVPFGRLVVATNENDVLDEFFRTGTYRVRDREHTFSTSSPSMDISKASNFERYVFDVLERESSRVKALFSDLNEKKEFSLTREEFRKVLESGVASAKSTHAMRLETIRTVYRDTAFMIDPHTADGVHAAKRWKRPGIAMLALETAQAAKFSQTIEEAIGIKPPIPELYGQLEDLPQRVTVMENDPIAVKEFIETHCRTKKDRPLT